MWNNHLCIIAADGAPEKKCEILVWFVSGVNIVSGLLLLLLILAVCHNCVYIYDITMLLNNHIHNLYLFESLGF